MDALAIIHRDDFFEPRDAGIYCPVCLEQVRGEHIDRGYHPCGATVTLAIGPAVGL